MTKAKVAITLTAIFSKKNKKITAKIKFNRESPKKFLTNKWDGNTQQMYRKNGHKPYKKNGLHLNKTGKRGRTTPKGKMYRGTTACTLRNKNNKERSNRINGK